MPSHLQDVRRSLEPLRRELLEHAIYQEIDSLEALGVLMQHHVFAVWDFMSLLKALQRTVCRSGLPWLPPTDAAAARLVNEIVLAEETDEDGSGGYASHFELYLRAMEQCGADTRPIVRFSEAIAAGRPWSEALADHAPAAAAAFVAETLTLSEQGEPAAIAAAFTFGREDLLPDVFERIVSELNKQTGDRLSRFKFYLQRHIELDGDQHGPMAERLVAGLCGDDPRRWQHAKTAAIQALQARLRLWDATLLAIRQRRTATERAALR